MPTRTVPLMNGHYYHVYNRVVTGRKLFYTKQHYLFYLTLWKEVDSRRVAGFAPIVLCRRITITRQLYRYDRISQKNQLFFQSLLEIP
jgi:hypothetical protein